MAPEDSAWKAMPHFCEIGFTVSIKILKCSDIKRTAAENILNENFEM